MARSLKLVGPRQHYVVVGLPVCRLNRLRPFPENIDSEGDGFSLASKRTTTLCPPG